MQKRTKAMAMLWRSNVQLWMSDSSNWARARLISSCMKRSSSILASFFASAGLDRTRRRSSTDKRDFRVGPAADRQTSVMYSIRISSITPTVSFAGFRSSPKPYIRFFSSLVNSPFRLDCRRPPLPAAVCVELETFSLA